MIISQFVNHMFYSMGGHGALICFLKNPGLYKVGLYPASLVQQCSYSVVILR